jgi:hypothetical protein
MKVIGTTVNGFILEATNDEVANLIGFHSSYSDGFPRKIESGTVINVSPMYRHLYALSAAERSLADMASKLRTAADLVGTLPDPLTPAPDKEAQ